MSEEEALEFISPQQVHSIKENINQINALPVWELAEMLRKGVCPYRPELLKGLPIGMHHCPACGEMVIAGLAHHPLSREGE